MAEKKRINWIILGVPVFLIYLFLASVPIPRERVLENLWMVSLTEAGTDEDAETATIPVRLGDRIGFVDALGRFSVNRQIQGYVALSDTHWSEYGPMPDTVTILDQRGETLAIVTGVRGYPVFIGGRTFMVAPEQQALTALGAAGNPLWTYEFSAPLTSLDASSDQVLAACLDGSITVLNKTGTADFTFEPGGSRLPVILSARISRNGRWIALISGIDAQRFLLLERFGVSYRVVFHEFLAEGFRRPVHLTFADGDRKVLFEREGGVGVLDIKSRRTSFVSVPGRIVSMETDGTGDNLYLIGADGDNKYLIGIDDRLTTTVTAPFSAASSFIRHQDGLLYLGGDGVLAAFAQREK